jgi:prevent-host-death family protein
VRHFLEEIAMTVTLEEAKIHLGELIAKVATGESVVITDHEKPVAQLVPPVPAKPRPQYGNCKGKLIILAEDDEHLKDFEEYMP